MTDDPLNINDRLYKQIGKLLDDLEAADAAERMTTPQRISALLAIGKVQTTFATLRKTLDDGHSGSAVRKYAAAFARPHAARGGKDAPRAGNVVEFDSRGGEPDGDDAA